MPINIFNLAGYTPNLFDYEPLQIFGSIDTILSEKSGNDCDNPIFHAEPETHKPWVEYYWQSASHSEWNSRAREARGIEPQGKEEQSLEVSVEKPAETCSIG